jgi:hypothetical protein
MRRYFCLALMGLSITLLYAKNVSAQTCPKGSSCVTDAPATCKLDFESSWLVMGCRASVGAGWDGISKESKSSSCIATPPHGYYMVDYSMNVLSRVNGSIKQP